MAGFRWVAKNPSRAAKRGFFGIHLKNVFMVRAAEAVRG
jgi:hypothetical protein